MKTSLRKTTQKIEMVETANLALSLRRLRDMPNNYTNTGWKRALLHAIQMSGVETGWNELSKIREALKLP